MPRLSESDIVVTTTRAPSPAAEASGVALAHRLDRPFVARGHDSLAKLARLHGVVAAVVAADDGIRLVHEGRTYGFHPGMARHRVAALENGRGDRFVEAARLRPGDRVLDCTCGLGADAVVAAHAVGDQGLVHAVEASAILAAVVLSGLRRCEHADAALVRAMRRVTVIHARHERLLGSLADGSWDVVYFDPMFVTTIMAAKGLDLVRLLASPETPDREVIAEAGRVAARGVIVKDRAPGPLLRALGIPVVSRTERICYGRLESA